MRVFCEYRSQAQNIFDPLGRSMKLCREERAAKEKKEWFEKDSYACDHTHTQSLVCYMLLERNVFYMCRT